MILIFISLDKKLKCGFSIVLVLINLLKIIIKFKEFIKFITYLFLIMHI